jgi:hypothetical protein
MLMQLTFLEALREYKKVLLSNQKLSSIPGDSLLGAVLSNMQSTAMDYAKHTTLLGPAACLYDVGDIPMIQHILLNLELPYSLITNQTREQVLEKILKIPHIQSLLQKLSE